MTAVAMPPVRLDADGEAVTAASASSWGWFPLLSVVNGFALLLLAFAYTASRDGFAWSSAVFWLSLLIIFVPAALRLIAPSISRRERIALVVLVGCSLYLVKILHSPLDFTFYDEFLHWQTANNILSSQHLFSQNSLLPVSPLYPGLEIVTTAFVNLTGLSVVEAGEIVLAVARLAFMMALYLFYEQISGSERIGGIAALLYAANSNFVFFDAQFSYESLSLPIAMTILYVVATLIQAPEQGRHRGAQIALVLALIGTLTITHHLTSYVLAGFAFLWAFAALIRRRPGRSWLVVGSVALIVLAFSLIWALLVGNQITSYLAPVFKNGIQELLSLLSFDGSGRTLFQSSSGIASPVWERIVGIAAVAFILLVLPVGAILIVFNPLRSPFFTRRIRVIPAGVLQTWHRYRESAAALALAGLVVLHPVMQGFRLTSSGWEIANRSSEFLFWAIAFILAVAVAFVGSFKLPRRLWLTGFAVWAGVIFVGGAISGSPPWSRLPGDYLVSADTRSIEPQGILAARWAANYLPPQSRAGADRINSLLLGVYGNQRVITHLADGVYLASVYFAPTLGTPERLLLNVAQPDYLLVDERMSMSLPMLGVYFEAGEPLHRERVDPISASALTKFDAIAGISRPFDSGAIRIYDVRALVAAP